MASRSKPYELVWPLNPEQLEFLELMLRELYEDLGATSEDVDDIIEDGGGGGGGLTSPVGVGDGGTGLTSVADEALLKGSGSSPLDVITIGTDGQVLGIEAGSVGWVDHEPTTPATTVVGEVVVWGDTTGTDLDRATGTGVAHLTSGILSAADVDLETEVTGDLPYANLEPATQGGVLLGRIDGAGDWGEVSIEGIAENDDGELSIDHDLLSAVHPDTIPASPVYGDLIVAGTAREPEAVFYNGVISAAVKDNFQGIRAAYVLGFNGLELPPSIVGWGAPPPIDIVANELADTWLSWGFVDGFIQAAVMDDFQGARPVMMAGNFGDGIGWAYTSFAVDIVETPDPTNLVEGAEWQRLATGDDGQVLTIVDDLPTWSDDLSLPGDLDVTGDTSLDDFTAVDGTLTGTLEAANLEATTAVTAPSIVLDGYALGTWTNVPYNAGTFTASGGTTPAWTVAEADQVCFRYTRFLSVVILQVFVVSSTVSSAAGDVTELRIKIPDGMEAVGTPAIVVGAQENGVATTDIYCTTEPSTDPTLIFLRKYPVGTGTAFDQTANGTFTGFTLIFEVS